MIWNVQRREHVAADELPLQLIGEIGLAQLAQPVEHFVELEVGLADELVEGVQVPAGALERLERLGHRAGGRDRALVIVVHPPPYEPSRGAPPVAPHTGPRFQPAAAIPSA